MSKGKGLAEQLVYLEGVNLDGKLPPVDSWHPDLSGDIDIVIKASGDWYHEGDLMTREKLVRLFSTILKREGDEYFLVTPVEKWRIRVEDLPFMVVLIQKEENGVIRAVTNLGDEFEIGEAHPVQMEGGSIPAISVRAGLMARFSRNAYYALAELATERNGQYFITSGNAEFQIA